MKPTNYHLFDFLDFDTELLRDESLWKARKRLSVYRLSKVTHPLISIQSY